MSPDHAQHVLRVLLVADPAAGSEASGLERADAIVVRATDRRPTCRAVAAASPDAVIIVVADIDDDGADRLRAEGAAAVVPSSISAEALWATIRDAAGSQRTRRVHDRLPPQLQALSRLAGGVAHDFNNLLLVVDGNIERLMQALPPREPLRRPVDAIAAASRRAAELTRQLLAFGRGQTLIPAIVDLNAVIADVMPAISMQLGPTIAVATNLARDLPAISADRSQLAAAIASLAANALEAMPDGGSLTIATDTVLVDAGMQQRRPWLTAGSFVRLQVSDTGSGVDEHTLPHLFEPFFAGEGVMRPTRLGLSSVYGTVKQSGGFIWAESRVGEGTRITVLLPAAHVGHAAEQARAAAASAANRVLLVEDDDAVREVLVESLARHGFDVDMAGCAEEALDRWSAGEFDLLVTDVVLPGMDGRQLARQIRSVSADTPVLFMSGYTGDALGPTDLESSRAFLQKPFTSAAFVDRVRELIRPASRPA
jgi:signal transduction histidine kinase/CheY-like chemotaxis protein